MARMHTRRHYYAPLIYCEHIHDKINKAYDGLIKRNFEYLTTESFTLLYKNMVRTGLN